MAIGWMIEVDVTGDGYKDSVRGYAVAIRNRDEAIAAARETSGERIAEVAAGFPVPPLLSTTGVRREGSARKEKTRQREPAGELIALGLARRISLRSGLVMDLLHQSLERAPADFAKVAIVVGHQLLAAAGTVDVDASPSQIVVRFAEAAIANKSRFRSHARD